MISLSNQQNFNNALVLRPDNDYFSQSNNMKLYNPTIGLTGHQGEVYTGKFSNEGYIYATAGHDKSVLLWEVYEKSCRNLTALQGHTNAILELAWSQDDSKLYTCSADKSVCIWDIYESKRIKKLKGHESVVNCISTTRRGQELVRIKICN
jgi:Prp8 binding protein